MITFVGLPESEMFMQGRTFKNTPLGAPVGTLRRRVPKNCGLEIAMSVSNVTHSRLKTLLILIPCALFWSGIFSNGHATGYSYTLVVSLFLFLPTFLLPYIPF
jgi:hypothetical protein